MDATEVNKDSQTLAQAKKKASNLAASYASDPYQKAGNKDEGSINLNINKNN